MIEGCLCLSSYSFVNFPLHLVHSPCRDKDKIEKIISSLGLKLSARDTRNSDSRSNLQAVCRQWLPLSDAILGMVSAKLPSPLNVPEERIEKLMCGGLKKFDSLPAQTQQLKPGINIDLGFSGR